MSECAIIQAIIGARKEAGLTRKQLSDLTEYPRATYQNRKQKFQSISQDIAEAGTQPEQESQDHICLNKAAEGSKNHLSILICLKAGVGQIEDSPLINPSAMLI